MTPEDCFSAPTGADGPNRDHFCTRYRWALNGRPREVHPLNLFRIYWHNEPEEAGGDRGAVPSFVEFPPELTGVPCRIPPLAGL